MDTSGPGDPGLRTTIGGYVCPWCDGVFPSLHWFKHDPTTGTTVCQECSRETGSASFTNLVETPVPDDELFAGGGWESRWKPGPVGLFEMLVSLAKSFLR
jgi:hypothetical protein